MSHKLLTMRKTTLKIHSLVFLFCLDVLMGTSQSVADELKVAVASNFYPAMKVIAKRYELRTSGSTGQHHKVILIPGSSGKHYAQIINGAPFDVFFSADIERASIVGARREGCSWNEVHLCTW